MEHISKKFIEEAENYFKKVKDILIFSHKNPDGDAVGSGLALYLFLKNKGYSVHFVLPNDIPEYLNWMPNAESIKIYTKEKEKINEWIANAELIFMLDFNSFSRIDTFAQQVKSSKAVKIMIDHHPNPEPIFTINYTRISSSSTSEMTYEFIEAMGDKKCLTKDIATCLFVGIMTDTGCFNYNSSHPFTFLVTAKLLNLNLDKNQIINNIYNNYSESRLRLLGFSVNEKMKVFSEYQTAYIFLTRSELSKYNFKQGDTEGFVNYPLSIKGIVFTAIFLEKDGYTKCSFRSIGNFPANEMAKDYFSGGGHLNAAGGEFKGSVQEVIKKFEYLLPTYYQKYKDNIDT